MQEENFRTRAIAPIARVQRSMLFGCIAALISVTASLSCKAEDGALTETDAIRSALSRPAYKSAISSRITEAETQVTEASLLPNPVVSIQQERAGGTTELLSQISQSIDIAGRRGMKIEAETQRLAAVKYDSHERQHETVAEVRLAFAEALYQARLATALELWLSRIQAATRIATQLAKAGEVSGYDRRRFERETQTAQAKLLGVQADAGRNRQELAALTGKPAQSISNVQGELLPDAPPAIAMAQDELSERPDLTSLVSQAKAFDIEQKIAERAWVPEISVGIGQKHVEDSFGADNGLILGLSASIPIFNHGQAAELRSAAQAQAVRAEHELKLSKARAELEGVWLQAKQLREVAQDFRQESLTTSRELSVIAEAAYRAGEASLLELLDSYRVELDAELTALDLEKRARLARIELDTLSGAPHYE